MPMKRNYVMVDGVPTSKYGTAVMKRCGWCYGTFSATDEHAFCSQDCKDESRDYEDLTRNYKKLKYYHAHKNLKGRITKNIDKHLILCQSKNL